MQAALDCEAGTSRIHCLLTFETQDSRSKWTLQDLRYRALSDSALTAACYLSDSSIEKKDGGKNRKRNQRKKAKVKGAKSQESGAGAASDDKSKSDAAAAAPAGAWLNDPDSVCAFLVARLSSVAGAELGSGRQRRKSISTVW